MAKVGNGAAGHSLTWGVSLWKGKDTLRFWLLSLSASEGSQAAVAAGRIHLHCRVLSPAAFSYRE